jgi:hypothetical protein
MNNKFTEDFDFFWGMIENSNNFSFLRFADGEVLLMEGKGIGEGTQALNVDKWSSPNNITKVGGELHDTLNLNGDDVYYAISSKSDNINDYNYLYGKIKNKDNITFANLWINSNYKEHKKRLMELKRPVTLICNENALNKSYPFNVEKVVPFPNDCINFWESVSEDFLGQLLKYVNEKVDHLFLVCCGPVSEIIIYNMRKINKNNTYIDMGSSLDEFIHGKITRPYMVEGNKYSTEKSHF